MSNAPDIAMVKYPAAGQADRGAQGSPEARTPIPAAGWWTIICAFCNCAGWGLSALHQLNTLGYAIVVVAGILAAAVCAPKRLRLPRLSRLRRRFRRPFPFCFAALAGLAIAGGILHAPNNYDGLAYRTPRLLHWVAAGHWHWIPTEFQRLNTRASGFEWVTAPALALARTDRFFFLINVVSFVLLPGLIFGVFRQLSLRSRVAWHWMWLLPCGGCFLTQAGSIGNDLFGAVFPLAALFFALRAKTSGKAGDIWLSALSAALMTSGKPSNIPLLLPWLVAVAPSLKLLPPRLGGTIAIGLIAVGASFLPQAWMNVRRCGDWTGATAEAAQGFTRVSALRVANNVALLTLQNLAPPIMPFARLWNQAVPRAMPELLREKLERSFEPAGAHWQIDELAVEESAALGLGVTGLVIMSFAAGLNRQRRDEVQSRGTRSSRFQKLILVSAWVALGPFLAKAGLSGCGRIIAPYYALMIPGLLLAGAQQRVVRTLWWRGLAFAVFAVSGLVLIISPARPLWPANIVLANLSATNHPLLTRAKTVYSVYAHRSDAFAPARKLLPPDTSVVGLVTLDDPETSLWRPFFSRRIEHVTTRDSLDTLRARRIEYIWVNPDNFRPLFGRDFGEWIGSLRGQIVQRIALHLRAAGPPSEWVLLKVAD